MGNLVVVKAARDRDAGVWFVESSDLPGLHIEATTLEEFADLLPGAVLDLLEAGGYPNDDGYDVPIELIAHTSTRARTAA